MWAWQEQHYIYCLRDPLTDEIGYVGYTCAPRERYHDHMRRAELLENEKDLWIMSLRERGVDVVFQIIEETTRERWEQRERYWIACLRNNGEPLTNECDGGKGPPRKKQKVGYLHG